MTEMFHKGDRIRKLREAQGWTQGDLAKAAGLALSTVNRAEKNDPSVELGSLNRIAAALGVPVLYLEMGESGVTYPVTPSSQTPATQELPMPDSARAQLVALCSSIPEPEAAIVLPHVRQLLAQLWQRQQTQKK